MVCYSGYLLPLTTLRCAMLCCVMLCCAGCSWQEAVPNVHLGVYGYADAYSCGPGMAFARTLVHTRSAHTVRLGCKEPSFASCRSPRLIDLQVCRNVSGQDRQLALRKICSH
jgi:hypothetical protein